MRDRKPPIVPISSLGSNFNPQNTHCIPPVKIIARLELDRICRFSFRHYLLVEAVNIKELLLKIQAEKGVMYCKQ